MFFFDMQKGKRVARVLHKRSELREDKLIRRASPALETPRFYLGFIQTIITRNRKIFGDHLCECATSYARLSSELFNLTNQQHQLSATTKTNNNKIATTKTFHNICISVQAARHKSNNFILPAMPFRPAIF